MDDATTTNDQVSSTHMPDDVAFSILSKLPLKSLKRFSCVQKSWSLLFQNPYFMDMFRNNFFISKIDEGDDETCLLIKEHTQSFPVYHSLSILSGERFEDRVKLDWPPLIQEYDNPPSGPFCIAILGSASVNGTICLYEDCCYYDSTTFLWNPATGEFKVIPPSFQPYENIELNAPPQGFGYNVFKEDYKVIRNVEYPIDFEGNWIYLPDKDDPFWETDVHELDMNDYFWIDEELIVDMYDPFWEIYSLKSNSWSKLDGVDMPVSWGDKSRVNLNEFVHWLSIEDYMVSFDFSKEIFFATALPSDLNVVRKCDLMALNGYVSLISYHDKTYFHIWVLGELGVQESWTKFFVVGPFNCMMWPIGAGKKSHIFFTNEKRDELAWFDLRTMNAKIGIKGDLVRQHIVIYKENLLPFEWMKN